jgi:hypothetical protein
MKIHLSVQRLLLGHTQTKHTHTDRHADDLISLILFFGKWLEKDVLESGKRDGIPLHSSPRKFVRKILPCLSTCDECHYKGGCFIGF